MLGKYHIGNRKAYIFYIRVSGLIIDKKLRIINPIKNGS